MFNHEPVGCLWVTHYLVCQWVYSSQLEVKVTLKLAKTLIWLRVSFLNHLGCLVGLPCPRPAIHAFVGVCVSGALKMSLTSGVCWRLRRFSVCSETTRRSTAAAWARVSVDRKTTLSSSCSSQWTLFIKRGFHVLTNRCDVVDLSSQPFFDKSTLRWHPRWACPASCMTDRTVFQWVSCLYLGCCRHIRNAVYLDNFTWSSN